MRIGKSREYGAKESRKPLEEIVWWTASSTVTDDSYFLVFIPLCNTRADLCEKKIMAKVMILDFWDKIVKVLWFLPWSLKLLLLEKPTATENKQPWGRIEDSCQGPAPGHLALEADLSSPGESQMTAASWAFTSWNAKTRYPWIPNWHKLWERIYADRCFKLLTFGVMHHAADVIRANPCKVDGGKGL